MLPRTRRAVEQWWCELFGVDGAALWSTVTVLHPHGELGDYGGWYVAWRDDGVHVSAPSTAETREVARLRDTRPVELQSVAFWETFARQRGLEVIGPSVHRYLDEDPGAATDVRQVPPAELRAVAARVDRSDLWESGFDVHLDEPGVVAFAVDGGGAVLTELGGAPRNVALLVAPDARGRGVGTQVGRAAASYAVRHHDWCRWRSRDTNVPSSRAAGQLGFEPYAVQLAIRSGASPA